MEGEWRALDRAKRSKSVIRRWSFNPTEFPVWRLAGGTGRVRIMLRCENSESLRGHELTVSPIIRLQGTPALTLVACMRWGVTVRLIHYETT
jgi:hypothetical protein